LDAPERPHCPLQALRRELFVVLHENRSQQGPVGIAQGQLGTLLGLEKSTVSRLAAGLERKGWVRRGRDEANQRYIRLYLTPEGSRVAAQVWNAWQTRQARILAALTAEERAGLGSGLRGLIRGLAAEGLVAVVASPSGDAPAEGSAPARPG